MPPAIRISPLPSRPGLYLRTPRRRHIRHSLFKTCVLGVQYGMGYETLAQRISGSSRYPRLVARELLDAHRKTYATFWRWSDLQNHATLRGFLQTALGWHLHIDSETNPRSLRNFPVQANGAEMLRLACCLATEREVEVCAPVHDAVLICAPLDRLDADIERMQAAMVEASSIILGGFELRTDVHVVRYPDRYSDERGVVMWEKVMRLIEEVSDGQF